MVADLQAAQEQLQVYADQVDELAAIEERSRLARELQSSVSGTLAIALEASAAARASLHDPDRRRSQLERLQAMTQQALAQMRRIIGELRPPARQPVIAGASEPTAAERGRPSRGASGRAADSARPLVRPRSHVLRLGSQPKDPPRSPRSSSAGPTCARAARR